MQFPYNGFSFFFRTAEVITVLPLTYIHFNSVEEAGFKVLFYGNKLKIIFNIFYFKW